MRIEFSTQYKNQQCVRTLCVRGCVEGKGKGGEGAGGVSQHAIRISFKREHVAEILTPRFHLRNCANEPTAGRTHVSEGRVGVGEGGSGGVLGEIEGKMLREK